MAERDLDSKPIGKKPQSNGLPSRPRSMLLSLQKMVSSTTPQHKSSTVPVSSRSSQPPSLSEFSSPAVPDSGWASENFMLGAGMVIIQPSTHKLVVLFDTKLKYWFLPRGRKDIGESLETTALREAYEEVEFLPLYTPTHAPAPPEDKLARDRPNTEPFYTSISNWRPGQGNRRSGGEYLTFWYVGQIPQDAVYVPGTGMADEQTYTSHLCTFEEAMERVWGNEIPVVQYAWKVYRHSYEVEKQLGQRREAGAADTVSNDDAPKGKQEDQENRPLPGDPQEGPR